METALIIWAIGVLPNIGKALVAIGIIGFVVSLAVGIPCIIERVFRKRVLVIAVFLFGFIGFTGGLIPDKSTLYAMVAGYGVQTVAENPKVQEVASDAGDVLASYLKKIKKELDEEAK